MLHRGAPFVVAFALASGLVWKLGERIVAISHAERFGTGLDLPPRVAEWRAGLLQDPAPHRVAMLGDSMLGSPPGMRGVPDRIDALLRHQGAPSRRATVHALTFPVLWPIAQYCLADEVALARPDLVVLELNLRALEPGPLGAFSYTELAGWIDWRRVPEASVLPLSDAGITENRLLFYKLLVAARLEGPWDALIGREARLANSRDVLESWLGKRLGGISTAETLGLSSLMSLSLISLPGGHRGTSYWLHQVLGAALDGVSRDAGRLRVLGATLRRFHDAGIPAMVWVSPTNTDHLQSVGIHLGGLKRTIANARAVVEANGGAFYDFHAALENDQFRDQADHFTLDGDRSGGATLAAGLARAILRTLPESAPPSSKAGARRARQ